MYRRRTPWLPPQGTSQKHHTTKYGSLHIITEYTWHIISIHQCAFYLRPDYITNIMTIPLDQVEKPIDLWSCGIDPTLRGASVQETFGFFAECIALFWRSWFLKFLAWLWKDCSEASEVSPPVARMWFITCCYKLLDYAWLKVLSFFYNILQYTVAGCQAKCKVLGVRI